MGFISSRILLLCSGLILFLHLAANQASGTPLIVAGQVGCIDEPGMVLPNCSVFVRFFHFDGEERITEPFTGMTHTDKTGTFVVTYEPDIDHLDLNQFAQVTAICDCWKSKTITTRLDLRLDFASVLEAAGFNPGPTDVVLAVLEGISGVGGLSLLSPDLAAFRGATLLELERAPFCIPEPTTFLLVGASLLLAVSRSRSLRTSVQKHS